MARNRTTSSPSPSLAAVASAFAIVYFVWGSTYLGIAIAIETLPPFLMAALRFLTAGTLLFVGSLVRGAALPRAIEWRSALIVGVLLLVTGNGLLTWAEQYVASGVAALIVATVPIWMVLLDALWPGRKRSDTLRSGRSRPTPAVIAGLLLGLVGIVVLIGPGELGGARVHVVGALVILVAAFSWAVGSIYSRSAPQASSTLLNVGMQMLLGGVVLLAWGLAIGERIDPATVSARSWWALVYLALLGGVVSYSAYVWLLKVASPAKVATYAYVNPVVAVVLGWALGGEALNPRVFGSMAAVVTAVVLITASGKRARGNSSKRLDEPVAALKSTVAGEG